MKQKKTQTGTGSFNQTLIGDYYINSLESLINSSETQNIDELKSFVNSVCSKEKKEEFNGSFDDYFNQTLNNNDEKRLKK